MPYSQASDHNVIAGLTKNMLLIGNPLVVTCWRNFTHSWRYSRCHSLSRCGTHFTPSLVSSVAYLRSIVLLGWHVLRDWSFQKNIPEYLSYFLLKLMYVLVHWFGLFVYLQVGIPSYSECLCTNLGISCARKVVPPPSVSLRRVNCLVSGVMMAVVVIIVYGWPIEPRFLRDLSSVCHRPLWWWFHRWNNALMPQWLWYPLIRGLMLQDVLITAVSHPVGVRIGVASLDHPCPSIHLKIDRCLGPLPLH